MLKTLGLILSIATFVFIFTSPVQAVYDMYQAGLEYVHFYYPVKLAPQSPYSPIVTGVEHPKLTFYLFGDLNGPFTKQYLTSVFPVLQEKYGNQSQFVYIHTVFDPDANSYPMAVLGECVAQQGQFWNNIPVFRERQEQLLSDRSLLRNVNLSQLSSCEEDPRTKSKISSDTDLARKSVQGGNPVTIIVNNENPDQRAIKLAGAMPVEYFDRAVSELQTATDSAAALAETQQKLATVEAELAVTKQHVSFLQQQVTQLNEFISSLLASIRGLWK